MASLLFGWELGANLGHTGPFLPVARELRRRGHEVHWVVAQPGAVGALLDREGFSWLPAPVATETPRPGAPVSYTDILLRFGYGSTASLLGLTGAWRELMRLTGARLVLADHAPTALLAARSLDLPAMLYSYGFCVPPRRTPLPAMRSWQSVPEQQLRALDTAALASVNGVLDHYGKPRVAALADLFQVAESAIATYPELDHYGDRGPANYWGSLANAGNGRPVVWPDLPGRRIFAYLRPECVYGAAVIEALHALGQPTVVYFPNMPEEWRVKAAAPHLLFLDSPADLEQMTAEADLAIAYAGLATTTAFLLAGKPLLLLPNHLEQFLLAKRVGEMGAGQVVDPERPCGDLRQPIAALLNDPFWRDNARAFSRKYESFNQAKVLDHLSGRIEALLTATAKDKP